ncbi:hypothetical protein PYCC9005_003931 [Savitreella phatthalungensis]
MLNLLGYLAAAAGVLYIWSYLRRYYYSYKLGAHWPTVSQSYVPFGLDNLYEMLQYSKRYENLELLQRNYKKYGRTFLSHIIGESFLITHDPENVKAVLATQFQDFGKGPIFHAQWYAFLGNSIFNSDGEVWAHNRALMRPQFLKERVADLDNFEDKMTEVLDMIKPGQVTDVMDLWFRFTFDSATEHLFGERSHALHGDNEFAAIFAKIQELQVARARRGPTWKWWPQDEFNKTLNDLNNYVDKYVQMALAKDVSKTEEEDESLLTALVRFNRDPKFLRDALNAALLAGRDTTAATLTWLTMRLSQRPDVYAALREEIDLTGRPTYTQLKNYKLLQGCINETLRLYPIVPMNVRTALRDTTLPHGGGPDGLEPICVPKDTQIMYAPVLMHRLTGIDNVDEWDPHRWLDTPGRKKYVPKPFSYIPFNAGPRICLGQNFALTEIAYAMVKVLQRFPKLDFVPTPNAKGNNFRYDIILTPHDGAQAIFRDQ